MGYSRGFVGCILWLLLILLFDIHSDFHKQMVAKGSERPYIWNDIQQGNFEERYLSKKEFWRESLREERL